MTKEQLLEEAARLLGAPGLAQSDSAHAKWLAAYEARAVQQPDGAGATAVEQATHVIIRWMSRFPGVGLGAVTDSLVDELRTAERRGAERERSACLDIANKCVAERASQEDHIAKQPFTAEFGRIDVVHAKGSEAQRIADAIAARGAAEDGKPGRVTR